MKLNKEKNSNNNFLIENIDEEDEINSKQSRKNSNVSTNNHNGNLPENTFPLIINKSAVNIKNTDNNNLLIDYSSNTQVHNSQQIPSSNKKGTSHSSPDKISNDLIVGSSEENPSKQNSKKETQSDKNEEKIKIELNDLIGPDATMPISYDMLNNIFIDYPQGKSSSKSFGVIKAYAANTYRGIVRGYNEDRVSIVINMNQPIDYKSNLPWPKVSYFGVFDGHGGNKCAEYLRDNLLHFICTNSFFPKDIPEAIKEGFYKADQEFLSIYATSDNEDFIVDRSGSCGLILLIVDFQIYVGNVGDSRCIVSLQKGNIQKDVTRDHKPNMPYEKERITANGGMVYQTETPMNEEENEFFANKILIGPYRVLPGRLSVSRTIGDAEAKLEQFGGKPNVVIPEPDIFNYSLNDDDIDYFILGCDGIFDQLNSKDVFKCAKLSLAKSYKSYTTSNQKRSKLNNCMTPNKEQIIGIACGNIVDFVLKASMSRKSFDNVTCIIIAFKDLLTSEIVHVNNQIIGTLDNKKKYKITFNDYNCNSANNLSERKGPDKSNNSLLKDIMLNTNKKTPNKKELKRLRINSNVDVLNDNQKNNNFNILTENKDNNGEKDKCEDNNPPRRGTGIKDLSGDKKTLKVNHSEDKLKFALQEGGMCSELKKKLNINKEIKPLHIVSPSYVNNNNKLCIFPNTIANSNLNSNTNKLILNFGKNKLRLRNYNNTNNIVKYSSTPKNDPGKLKNRISGSSEEDDSPFKKVHQIITINNNNNKNLNNQIHSINTNSIIFGTGVKKDNKSNRFSFLYSGIPEFPTKIPFRSSSIQSEKVSAQVTKYKNNEILPLCPGASHNDSNELRNHSSNNDKFGLNFGLKKLGKIHSQTQIELENKETLGKRKKQLLHNNTEDLLVERSKVKIPYIKTRNSITNDDKKRNLSKRQLVLSNV